MSHLVLQLSPNSPAVFVKVGPSDKKEKVVGKLIPNKLAIALAGGLLLLGITTANATSATVVTDTVVSQAAQSQGSVPVTFGQIFKAGDIPRGSTVSATLGGQPIPIQVDVKATNPDGSLRHAVLTTMVPSLLAGDKLPLSLSAISLPATTPARGNVTLAQLLSTNYDAQISLSINGQGYSLKARDLLQAAEVANSCVPWGKQCNLWLSGPKVSEWVVSAPLTAASGTRGTNLRVTFSVRAYASATPGAVGDVRTDVVVENTDAFAPQEQPRYTATVTSGSASYVTPALTQYAYTRWHKLLWWNNARPLVYLQQDTQYIQNSKVVSRYMSLNPTEKFLAGLRQSCSPLDHCDQTPHMGNTGAQPSIGPLPRWSTVYMVHPDVRAYNWMIANTDALGAYSTHYRDAQTGWPVSIELHPLVTTLAWSYANGVAAGTGASAAAWKKDLLPNCLNNSFLTACSTVWYGTGNPYVWDNAHQPSGAYLPYMVTGDYYYMSELAFDASLNELVSNPEYRGRTLGLIDASHGQVRGKAWVLREMSDASFLLPDHYPMKDEFTADVNNSLADWATKYTNNPNANPLSLMNAGAVYSLNGGHANGVAPWQHNFLTWSAGHAADLGFADAVGFRNWLSRFEVGLMTDWQANPQGYCWVEGSAYSIQVKDTSGNWFPSYSAVYAANFPTLLGFTCNSPEFLTALSKLRNAPVQPGEMPGYSYSATGFPANFQIGMASAADSNLPKAHAAWALFDSRSVKPSGVDSYDNYPNFAVVPRSVPYNQTPSPPPVNPPPVNPPPVNPPPVNTSDVWQTLIASEKIVTVGDTFAVVGTLHYKAGMTKPVTAYRLYGYNAKILGTPNSYTPKVVALTVGTTVIRNDNSGTTGTVTITVVPKTDRPPVKTGPTGQILTVSRKVVTVGEAFTVVGTLNYGDGSSKPVTAYRLYGYDKNMLEAPNSWTTRFVALKAGTTQIRNDNSGVTGIVEVTVVNPKK